MKKIIFVICIIIVGFFAVKAIFQSEGTTEAILSKVVILDEPKVLTENEGKLVLVSGKISCDKELKDEEFEVNIKTPKLERIVNIAQYTNSSNKKQIKYKWFDKITEEFVEDETGKKYYNPERKPIENQKFTQKSYIGEFGIKPERLEFYGTNEKYSNLSDDFAKKYNKLKFLYEHNRKHYDNLSGENRSNTNFKDNFTKVIFTDNNPVTKFARTPQVAKLRIKDNGYTTVGTDDNNSDFTRVGDIDISFHYIDTEKLGEVSFLAKQSEGDFEEYILDNGKHIYEVYTEKIDTKEKLENKLQQDKSDTFIGVILVLFVCIIIGVILFKEDIKLFISKKTKKK